MRFSIYQAHFHYNYTREGALLSNRGETPKYRIESALLARISAIVMPIIVSAPGG